MPIDLVTLFSHQRIALGQSEVSLGHLTYQGVERNLRLPTQPLTNPTGIAKQGIDLGRPEITRVHTDYGTPATPLDSHLLVATSAPLDIHLQHFAGADDEIAHGMLFAGSHHIVLGLALLQHQPLRAHVVARVPPVASGVEIAE